MNPFTKRMVQNAEALAKAREKDPSLNKSIHPRVVYGRTCHAKVNTCDEHKGKGVLSWRLNRRNIRRNDHGLLLKEGGMRGAPKQQIRVESNGYRVPGSMTK